MNHTVILCASDLSEASEKAVTCAIQLATKLDVPARVLHVLHSEEAEERAHALAILAQQLTTSGANGRAETLLLHGEPLETIAAASAGDHRMVVVATHGLRGLRQKLFGADILKLVRMIQRPTLVVQEKTTLHFEKGPLVMPVAAHEDIHDLIEAVSMLASIHDNEVHVYQLHRPGEEPSEELLLNKQQMISTLRERSIRVMEVNEPLSIPSISFAGPTLEYAARVNACCIAMMRHASREYRYMADAEKERLLTNDHHIPILCG